MKKLNKPALIATGILRKEIAKGIETINPSEGLPGEVLAFREILFSNVIATLTSTNENAEKLKQYFSELGHEQIEVYVDQKLIADLPNNEGLSNRKRSP